MKKIFVAVVMAAMGLLIMTPVASAYPVNVGDYVKITIGTGNGVNGGGAFDIYKGGDLEFDTFCLERNEFFTPNSSYYIGSITDRAINGGLGGQPFLGANYDLLSSESAYLYYEWATKAISNTAANANALQLAIWKFEDEWVGGNPTLPDWDSTPSLALARSFYKDAQDNHNGTLYGVAVMNMYGLYNSQTLKYTEYKQDLLVYNAVPEPATMLLLGLGLIGLSGVRRITRRK